MSRIRTLAPGIAVSALIAVVCWFLGQAVPLVGGAVFAILLGMVIGTFWKDKGAAGPGIKFASKKILQTAVVLLGFGLPLTQLAQVGAMSLPVILSTISASLITAAVLCRVIHVPGRTATLIGVGSSICGGSAIAATAPVIKADDQEVAHAISVVFLFNVLAALIFPTLGDVIGLSNNGFGLFAGTAVNDTSSVTAAAAVWDDMHPGANALDYATIVKLTRTLAIIPITFALALWVSARERKQAAQNGTDTASTSGFSLKRALPTFIVLFVCASLVATTASAAGIDPAVFAPLKTLSKFFIVVAMAAIGLNTDVVGLVKSGAKPIVLGAACWVAIACTSLAAQHALGLW
ncbi:YeiH family protein [uncultured Senegalimassilia sp.]|uniref:YeiH family protein n=1 Tax=uncultured Senegalimassilia sp. TaxID=1714350 RepID=UPI0025EB8D22|nr:YeiH family protein [uncultured Senegalimassilia sp.]